MFFIGSKAKVENSNITPWRVYTFINFHKFCMKVNISTLKPNATNSVNNNKCMLHIQLVQPWLRFPISLTNHNRWLERKGFKTCDLWKNGASSGFGLVDVTFINQSIVCIVFFLWYLRWYLEHSNYIKPFGVTFPAFGLYQLTVVVVISQFVELNKVQRPNLWPYDYSFMRMSR